MAFSRIGFHISMMSLAIAAGVLSIGTLQADEATQQAHQQLLEQALLANDSQLREELFTQVAEQSPRSELARWHQGQLRYEGEWQSVEAIAQSVASDPRRDEYQERLAFLDQTATGHAELAAWCERVDLDYQAKWHWLKVLEREPNSSLAMSKLDLQRVDGKLYSREFLEQQREREAQAKRDYKRYSKQLARLVRSVDRGSEAERGSALREIVSMAKPEAIEALMGEVVYPAARDNLLVASRRDAEREVLNEKLLTAVVGALDQIADQAATLRLLEIAVDAPNSTIRTSAAEALRYRPPTNYVPLLMASMAMPLESVVDIQVLPSGRVTLWEEVFEEGPLRGSLQTRSSHFVTQTIRQVRDAQEVEIANNMTPGHVIETNFRGDLARAQAVASRSQTRIEQANAVRKARNVRIQEVLTIALGEDLGPIPRDWWNAWINFNELDYPDEYQVQEVAYTETHPRITYQPLQQPHSCFARGTPVWTLSGPRPIETISVGDMVLSQDPQTGELDYRPVLETTYGDPTPSVEIAIPGEKLISTRNHRFWVARQGWRMAKFLEADQPLYGLRGCQEIEAIETHSPIRAYNLVVGQFHTYFVGNTRLLVHDNTCPKPITTTLPGIETEQRKEWNLPVKLTLR